MQPKNFVLADNGPITIGKDGEQVDFDDIVEFELYAGTPAADLVRGYESDYLYYDTETPAFFDTKNPELNYENTGVNESLEGLIGMVPELAVRKADPYYGLDDADQLSVAKEDVLQKIWSALRLTDAGMMSDSPISPEQKDALIGFRDGLRDLANVTKAATVNELDMIKGITVPEVPEEWNWRAIL